MKTAVQQHLVIAKIYIACDFINAFLSIKYSCAALNTKAFIGILYLKRHKISKN